MCCNMYKQLTSQQRSQIFALLQNGTARKDIARIVGCSESTLSRELKRNRNKYGRYTWQMAHRMAMERRERTCKNRKIQPWILHKALTLLKEEQWSPRQISGRLNKQGIQISHERIYQAIRADETGELRKHCRHKMKYRHHTKYPRKTSGKTLIPNRISIHDRPVEADGTRIGDMEMDLVIGKNGKSVVLTMVDRMTNMFFQSKVASKSPKLVAEAAYRLMLPFKSIIKTITTDNGMEFSHHQWLAKKLGVTIYFADPFCSGQKGAVENANKLLRQYFPKGTDFNSVTQEELNNAQKKINRRPREKLNFSSPVEVFFNLIL